VTCHVCPWLCLWKLPDGLRSSNPTANAATIRFPPSIHLFSLLLYFWIPLTPLKAMSQGTAARYPIAHTGCQLRVLGSWCGTPTHHQDSDPHLGACIPLFGIHSPTLPHHPHHTITRRPYCPCRSAFISRLLLFFFFVFSVFVFRVTLFEAARRFWARVFPQGDCVIGLIFPFPERGLVLSPTEDRIRCPYAIGGRGRRSRCRFYVFSPLICFRSSAHSCAQRAPG